MLDDLFEKNEIEESAKVDENKYKTFYYDVLEKKYYIQGLLMRFYNHLLVEQGRTMKDDELKEINTVCLLYEQGELDEEELEHNLWSIRCTYDHNLRQAYDKLTISL